MNKIVNKHETEIGGYTALYAVLKLSQDIAYTDQFTGEERKERIQGIAGFIPCYATYEEAEVVMVSFRYFRLSLRSIAYNG